jgi:carboxyl-terminal processing protease
MLTFSIAQLSKDFDFTQNETFTYDRDSLPFAASEDEIHQLWAKRVKYDLLNLKLTGKTLAANKETLKNVTQILSQSNKLSNQDVFQAFMDAFTEAIDPHTNYFNPSNAANFNIDMSRSIEGIGASLLMSENEYVTIKTVYSRRPCR